MQDESQNFQVRRVTKRFWSLDRKDATFFAEEILESWDRVDLSKGGVQSIPAMRTLNLALAFLDKKYPFLCCGKKSESADDRCPDCPMRETDMKE